MTRMGFFSQGRPAASFWVTAPSAVLLLGIALAYGFFTLFSRPLSLDEGIMMIGVRSFLEGHPLYDSVWTQYGPFYYGYEYLLHHLLSIPLTQDATRLLCLFHWGIASAILGLAGGIMTRSVFWGIFVFMQAVIHLTPIADYPGHPQELVAILLAFGLLAATRPVGKAGGMECLAMIAAALLFVKINVGTFFVFALLLSIHWHSGHRFVRGAWAWLVIAGSAVLPFVLMGRHVTTHPWTRNYSLLVAATLVATLLTAKDVSERCFVRIDRFFRPFAIFAAMAVLIAGIAVLTRTTLTGLVNGLIRMPLQTAEAAFGPLPVADSALCSAATSLLLAILVSVKPIHPRLQRIVRIVKALFGLAGIFCIGHPQEQLKYLLPWVWLVLTPGPPDRKWGGTFPRVFLSLMAAWQGLQSYPVSGPQVAMAALVLLTVCTVCLADTLCALAEWERTRALISGLTGRRLLLIKTFTAAAMVYFFAIVWCDLPRLQRFYASLTRLDQPGAALVRTDAATAKLYHELVPYLNANCDTYLVCPGMNNLYFWTQLQPRTHMNCGALSLLTYRQEEQLVFALGRAERPLIIMDEKFMPNLAVGVSMPVRPVIRALRDNYTEIHRIPPYLIFAPQKRAKGA